MIVGLCQGQKDARRTRVITF